MPSLQTLHLARHHLRRAHQSAVKRADDDVEIYATAHEEICELLGKVRLLAVLCHFKKDDLCDYANVSLVGIVGAAIGGSTAAILNLESAATGNVGPQSTSNGSPIPKRRRNRL